MGSADVGAVEEDAVRAEMEVCGIEFLREGHAGLLKFDERKRIRAEAASGYSGYLQSSYVHFPRSSRR